MRPTATRVWNRKVLLPARAVERLCTLLSGILGVLAIPLGLVAPAALAASLLRLQLTAEPDLPGGYEGLDGFVGLAVGIPCGVIGAALGYAVLPPPWRRRFVLAVLAVQAVLAVLGLADLQGFELVR